MKAKNFQKKMMCYFILLACMPIFISCESEIEPLPGSSNVIKSFKVNKGQVGNEVININEHTIRLTIHSSVDLTDISPSIVIADNATIFPSSGESIDISRNLQYSYKVVSASGREQEWTVYFRTADANGDIPDYGAYIITNAQNNNALGIQGDILYNDKYWDQALADVGRNNSEKWQKWHLIFDSEEDGLRYYTIRNLFSGLYLTVPDGSDFQGVNVYQDQLNTENPGLQLWRINDLGDGLFEMLHKQSELLLTSVVDITGYGVVALKPEGEGQSQQWQLNDIPLESYRDVQVQNFFRRNEPGMGAVAFDQGNSIPLTWGANNGKILWITEDAWDSGQMLGPDVLNGNSFFKYNNSILVQPSKDNWNPAAAVNLTNPDTRHPERVYQMMDVQPGLDWTWPGTGLEIDDKVYIYAGEGKGLESSGSALYILHQDAGTSWRVDRETPVNIGGPDGMVRGDDGYVYCYSNERTDWLGYETDVFVRRFQESDPLLDWEFWDGSGWTVSPAAKKAIAASKATTSVGKVGETYIMMSMDQGFFCTDERNIYLSYSSSPTGPWSTRTKVYEIEEYINGGKARFYTPIVHPYFTNDRGELLLSYCLNFAACDQEDFYFDENGNKALNAYYYRLKAIRVPLSLIGL